MSDTQQNVPVQHTDNKMHVSTGQSHAHTDMYTGQSHTCMLNKTYVSTGQSHAHTDIVYRTKSHT